MLLAEKTEYWVDCLWHLQ